MRRKTLSISLVLFACLALILCSTGSETFRWSLLPTAAADEGGGVSKVTLELATAMLAEKDVWPEQQSTRRSSTRTGCGRSSVGTRT